jgi:hypothetical protein
MQSAALPSRKDGGGAGPVPRCKRPNDHRIRASRVPFTGSFSHQAKTGPKRTDRFPFTELQAGETPPLRGKHRERAVAHFAQRGPAWGFSTRSPFQLPDSFSRGGRFGGAVLWERLSAVIRGLRRAPGSRGSAAVYFNPRLPGLTARLPDRHIGQASGGWFVTSMRRSEW